MGEWDYSSEPKVALTKEDLERAFESLREAAYEPHRHLVHPKAEGWTACADLCGAVFYVEQIDGRPQITAPPHNAAPDPDGSGA